MGGSGGEGAIIAAGGSPLGLAADIGGSIRTPAHFCGIQGLRPTSGRLSNLDSPPELFFPGMDAVVLDPGPMARTVADLGPGDAGARRAGPRASSTRKIPPVPWPDRHAVSIEGLRIGFFEDDGYWPASPALRRAVREAAEILTERGAIVEPFADPDPEAATRFYFSFLTADGVRWPKKLLKGNPRDRRVKMLLRISWVPAWLHRPDRGPAEQGRATPARERLPLVEEAVDRGLLGPAGAARRMARPLPRPDGRARSSTRSSARRTPCRPCATARPTSSTTRPSYLMRFNVLGMPAGSVAATRVRADEETDRPKTRDQVDRAARETEVGSAGLPVGVQVAARHWREDIVLAVMAVLEEEFSKRPDYPSRPPA